MSSNFPPPPPPGGAEDPSQQGGSPPPPPPAPAYGQGSADAPQGYGAPPPIPGGGYSAPVAVQRPPAMDKAVKLMQAGGIWQLVSLLLVFVSKGEIRTAVEESAAETDPSMTQSKIDAAVNAIVVTGIVFGLLGVALWFWMASVNGKGRSWGRIVATVLFAISLLSTLYSLFTPGAALSKVAAFVGFLIGAGAIYFMYQKESSDYYRAGSAPRV